MATYKIINTVELTAQGVTSTGKQGTATDSISTAFEVTVTGTVYELVGALADDTVNTLWDEDSNFPNTFNYLHFWSDSDCFLQLISSATNVILKVLAKQPYVLSTESLLAAADTTLITNGSDPSVTVMDSIALLNRSGGALNYHMILID